MKRVVIIDDEAVIRLSLQMGLEDEGFSVWTEETGESGLKRIAEVQPDLVFLDVRLPGKNGIEILKDIKKMNPDVTVLMMTAYGDAQSTVKALQAGAFDYIDKPFELEDVLTLIESVWTKEKKAAELGSPRHQGEQPIDHPPIICGSRPMLDVLAQIRQVAETNTSILIMGETGTGKELAAHAIHACSHRRQMPFIALNCGAIPSNLLESELFGFEKHAFTGADKAKSGLLELACGGTIFLDEIGELPLDIQVKLLRFLEDRKLRRVGGTKDRAIDVRVVAATNRHLKEMVDTGLFRKDLYYRLHVVPIYLPPLRDRGDDVVLLSDHFLKSLSAKLNKNIPGFSPAVLDLFRQYPWPGNVRELKNCIERLVILNHDTMITPSQLPEEIVIEALHQLDLKAAENDCEKASVRETVRPFPEAFHLERELERLEKQYIEQALHQTRWNLSKSAQLLGISRFSLQRRVKKYFGEVF
ncbi:MULTISPECIES: sigma-54-dependent transcriptional regulator [Paenibacillus]|uniref:Fis family transcriptional regulator n=1 Tax=Paenibacillus naphthalenovorans TaxID=162209 RepID=A0A0U2INS3_9BACL|nr:MULTISPECIES: sigma-54 dependent transcriptional regulator [Paenibacillus]ALS25195.1 Fis family transcriptional regulator [Paenibacillus naphthalenovorans]